MGQDLADHGQELQGGRGRRRGRGGGGREGVGREGGERTYSAGPQSTMYIRMYVCMHNFGDMVVQHTYVHTNLRIVVLKGSVHCHVFDHIPNEVVHFAFLHTRTANTHLATHTHPTQYHLEPVHHVNTS